MTTLGRIHDLLKYFPDFSLPVLAVGRTLWGVPPSELSNLTQLVAVGKGQRRERAWTFCAVNIAEGLELSIKLI